MLQLQEINPENRRQHIWIVGGILLLTFVAFLPGLSQEFTNWDDPIHLTENLSVRSLHPANLRIIFTESIQKIYIPLTTLSFAIEYHFFGYNSFIYHLENLLLHLGVTALVYFVGLRLGFSRRAAAVAALLHGIHPLRVESVVWVTERKDVLYAFFYMLSLHQYLGYLEKKEGNEKAYGRYGLSLTFALLGILAKPMALSLPIILLVVDWFKGRNFSLKIFLEKVPYAAVILPIAWITYAQHVRVPAEELGSAVLVWLWCLSFYFIKFIFPFSFSPLYPLPRPIGIFQGEYFLAVVLFLALIALIVRYRQQKGFMLAVLFYFCSIFFLLRFDDAMDKNIVADRFMYLPALGMCYFIGERASRLFFRREDKLKSFMNLARFCGIAVVIFLFIKTNLQTRIWQNTLTLWSHVIAQDPRQAIAYNNRGIAYEKQGEVEEARTDYETAVALKPDYAEAYNNLGNIYRGQGKYHAALENYNKVIELNAYNPKAYNNRGTVYATLDQEQAAFADYNKALELNPYYAEAYNNRANVLDKFGDDAQALLDYQRAIAIMPGYANAFRNRGIFYLRREKYNEALADFNRALDADPNFSYALANRAMLYSQMGEYDQALSDGRKARAMGAEIAPKFFSYLEEMIGPGSRNR